MVATNWDPNEASYTDAIDTALEVMHSMCGNGGQESIITNGEQDFTDWAEQVLNTFFGPIPSPDDLFSNIQSTVGDSAFAGTHIIWETGASLIGRKHSGDVRADDAYQRGLDKLSMLADMAGELMDSEIWDPANDPAAEADAMTAEEDALAAEEEAAAAEEAAALAEEAAAAAEFL